METSEPKKERKNKVLRATQSGFLNTEAGEAEAFCNETISWYDWYLRKFNGFVIVLICFCVYSNSYALFIKTASLNVGLNGLTDLLYIFLVFLRSRTGHLIDGVEERNLLKVRERYQTSIWFILDLITLIPFSYIRLIFPGDPLYYSVLDKQKTYIRLHYVLYFIVVLLSTGCKSFKYGNHVYFLVSTGIKEQESGSSTTKYRICFYLLISSAMIHFFACGWYGLACSNMQYSKFNINLCSDESWMLQSLIGKIYELVYINNFTIEGTYAEQIKFLPEPYLMSLYWASATSFSTGFGDIHAFTASEKIFSVFAMLGGVGFLYGMTVSGITSLLINNDARRAEFVHYYNAFKAELDNMHLKDQAKNVCLKYCDFLWNERKGTEVVDMNILPVLPVYLQSLFAEQTYKPLLSKADVFASADEAFMSSLARMAKHVVCLKGQYVQRCGEIPAMFCYVKSGVIEILGPDQEKVMGIMKEGCLFGQAHVTCGLPRLNSLRCEMDTELFMVQRHDFAKLLLDYPEVSQQITLAIERQCRENQWPVQVNTMYSQELLDRRRQSRKTSLLVDGSRRQSVRRSSRRHSGSPVDLIMEVDLKKTSSGFEILPIEKSSDIVRRSTLSTVNYKGIELSRAMTTSHTSRYEETGDAEKIKTIKNVDLEGATQHKESFWKRLERVTLIEPDGKFRKTWEMYLLVLSIITYNLTIFIPECTNTIGKTSIVSGEEAKALPILEMAKDGLYHYEAPIKEALENCNDLTDFDDIVECIYESGGHMSKLISGNSTDGYTIVIPNTWDLSYSGLSTENPFGTFILLFIYLVVDLSFYINIFINLRTKVKTKSGTLRSFKDLGLHYLRPDLIGVDLLIILPLELLAPMFSKIIWHGRMGLRWWWAILRANRLFCLPFHVPRLFWKLERSLDVNIVRLKITQVMVYILSISWTLACLSLGWSCTFITKTAYDYAEDRVYHEMCFQGSMGWKAGMSWERGLFENLMLTVYYILTISTSTGYGELPCTTKTKMSYAMVNMAIGTTLFGWLIAVIASGLSSDASATVAFTNAVKDTKDYLAIHAVPTSLINRVLDCRYIQWVRYQGTATPGVDTIGHKLSEPVNEMFMYEGTRQYVERIPLFYELPPSLISLLCDVVETHHYSQGDVIIYEGDLCSAIHLIRQGHCIVVSPDLKQKTGALHAGDYFCEMEILHGLGSSRTVVADSTCEILLLYREDIFGILDSYAAANFPLSKIMHDHSYENEIIAKMHEEQGKYENEVKMEKRYALQSVAGGVMCYGDALIDHPNIRRVEAPTGGFLDYFLLPYTFDPHTKQYFIYETIRFILTFITLIVMPLQIAYHPQSSFLMTIQYLLDATCLFDQYIKLHTMYYNDRQILVFHPVSTAKHYLKTTFIGDFISWFPFEIFVLGAIPGPWTQHQWKFFAVMRLPRFLQVVKFSRYIDYWCSDVRYKRRYVKHLSNIVFAILLHHWMSCILFTFACYPSIVARNYTAEGWLTLNGTGLPMYVTPKSWIGRIVRVNGLPAISLANSVAHQYLVSIYWATATLVCVGYGDVFPVLGTDRLIACFTMFLGLVFYSLILGDIAANMQMDDMKRANFKKRLSDIKRFFKVHHISKKTEDQVISYYCYLWERTRGITPEDLLQGLSPSLRTSVCQSMYDEMLRESFGCSKAMASTVDAKDINGFFRVLSTKVHPRIYLNGSVIFSQGSVGDEMYFIQRGNVAIYEDDDETVSKVLGPGQFFGEIALFSNMARQRTVAALTNCDLSVLGKQDLDSILVAFPQFGDIMKTIADDRRVGGTSSLSYVRTKSKADLVQNIVYDGKGDRVDGQDKMFFSKVVDNNASFANVWNNITFVLAWFSSCIVIYQAAYLNRNPTLDTLGFLMDVWFMMDMVVAFHTSYLDQIGNVVDTKNKIHEYYGRTWNKFPLDFIANIPIDLFGHAAVVSGSLASTYGSQLMVLSYLRLNRVLRLKKLFENSNKWEKDLHRDTLTVRMYKFVLILFFIINLFGSGFYFVGCPGGVCDPMSWTTASLTDYKTKGILPSDFVPWVDGCYWVVATITTTGYGDIRPETTQEIIYSCIVMVAGKLFIGYILSMLAATLANDDSRRVWYQERVGAVSDYMKNMKFEKHVSELVMRYYDYIWMKNQGVQITSLFDDLCYSLRADIFHEIIGKDMAHSEIFAGCSSNFIRLLSTKVRPVAFMPGEYICVQGDVRDEMFVVYRGVVEVFETGDHHEIKPIRLVMPGESYLCESVLKKTRLTCSIRARTYVDAFFLQMEDLQDAIEQYPVDKDLLLANAYKAYGDLHLDE